MPFNPNVEEVLKRFTITKPNEQFEVGPVAPDPTSAPDPLDKSEFDTPDLPIVNRLEDEAARVQEILDIITSSVDEITVPVPLEDAPFIGATVSTKDYLAALESNDSADPLRGRKIEHFEWGVLTTYGDNPHWPVLMSSDLIDIRNTLLNASDMIEGRLLSDSQTAGASGSNQWKTDLLNSDLIHVHESIILASAQVRFKVAQSVFTLKTSFTGGDVDRLLGLAIDPVVENIRPNIISLISWLKTTRCLLTHGQLIVALEYIRSRDAVLNIIETAIIDRLLNIVVVKLSNSIAQLVNPMLDALENGIGQGPLQDILTDDIGTQLVNVIGGVTNAIVSQYKNMAADLLREHNKKTHMQLDKLQFLGERNTIGRWITHIDQMITILQRLLSDFNLSREIAANAINNAIKPPPPPNLTLLQRFLDHPELSQAQNIDLKIRSYGITPQLEGPPVVPFFGEMPEGPLPSPSFGVGDVNPSSVSNRF